MAQATATMGPPLSPRETRRSGRRSAPSVSASASKSPDSDQPPRDKSNPSRVPHFTISNRSKRPKQEDCEIPIDESRHNPTGSFGSLAGNNPNTKSKRRTNNKEKDKLANATPVEDADPVSTDEQLQEPADEEEEQGITRCVCGSSEDDPDAGEFMVQCETCKVWQHGLCMGYQSEDQVHDDDYYCELCRPELHTELLKRLAKKPRQTSATSKHDTASNPRISRSHSPAHPLKQPSKRRNTMNSRDAAFDESLKEIIEATAAEAAAVQETPLDHENKLRPDIIEASKKKRKRSDDDINLKKRTRSASMTPDRQSGVSPSVDQISSEKPPPPASRPPAGRNKRGGRKLIAVDAADPVEVLGSVHKRLGNNTRSKHVAANRRPALAQSSSHGPGINGHEHGTRRNQSAVGQQSGSSVADARAYRNSHAFAVSQQTLFTSWNLPDYLSHLEPMLPTETPQPLEVRAGGSGVALASRGGSSERTMERGVKVRWPAKRMSIGDMNKRVRALVEWVGREQVSLEDRKRRRQALETDLRNQVASSQNGSPVLVGIDIPLTRDDTHRNTPALNMTAARPPVEPHLMSESALEMSAQTMRMMEELMEELIGFQERFGPGAKGRERERKLAAC